MIKQVTILLLLFWCNPIFAQQGVKGVVTDAKNNPVGFVTIYCKELKVGTNSNADGTYELKLPSGQHQVVFQSMGYKTLSSDVTISNGFTSMNIKLEEQAYNLKDVNVSSKGINPAVWIMRKAIAAAPYYKRQVLMYNAKVYIKGSGKLDDIPFLFEKTLKKDGIEEGKIFLLESINEVSFTQPNTFKEKALSVKSSLPVDGAPQPMEMARGSIYNTTNTDVVSPLSPQAFSVYDFKLEGSYYENGREVNKIKLTPKRKGQDVFSGYLYIMQGLWCVHSTDLTNHSSNFEVRIVTAFRPVTGYDYVWMPVTYDISVKGGFLGFAGSFRYLASVSNYKVKLNPNLDHKWVQQQTREQQIIPVVKEEIVEKPKPEKPKTKRQEDIEKLLAKDQLTKMEMLKLANKMKLESEATERNNLQVDIDSSTMEVDSMATKRDSSYWSDNRTVPLMESEVVSYKKSDSLALKKQKDTTVKDTTHHFNWSGLVLGDTYHFNKKKNYVNWSGAVGNGSEIFVNTVDGWGMAVQWKVGNRRTDRKEWSFTNKIRIPFERKVINSYGKLDYQYNPLKKVYAAIEGGSYISDFNTMGGPSMFVNNILLIFDRRNVFKLYQQEYVKLNNTIELANGFLWDFEVGWYHRYTLNNIDRFAQQETADGKITPNKPIAGYDMPTHDATIFTNTFTYTPRQHYRIDKGIKHYVQGNLPTFRAAFTTGTPSLFNSSVNYSKVNLSVTERIKIFHWLSVNARLTHGFFLSNHQTYFPDYIHFIGNVSPIFDGDPLYTFRQLDYYANSTTNGSTTLHAEFDFKRIVFKRLPYINMTNIREVMFYNGLLVNSSSPYQEIGYGLDNLFGFLRADVFAGFKGSSYNNWGARLIINIKFGQF